MVVVCHVPDDVVRGSGIELNNLPKGRVDLLARCVSSAIFLSHGVRENTRIWLQLQEFEMALCLDGATVRGEPPPPPPQHASGGHARAAWIGKHLAVISGRILSTLASHRHRRDAPG